MRLHVGNRLLDCGRRSIALLDDAPIERIVVDAPDVAGDMFPSVIADHRTRPIERVRQMIERLDIGLLRGIGFQTRNTPALVERHPGDNTGMAIVATNDVEPFARQSLDGGW